MEKYKDILYLNILKLENEILGKANKTISCRLDKYKILCKVKQYALELAVNKIVDNCDNCLYTYMGTACKESSCEKGMMNYFMEKGKEIYRMNYCFCASEDVCDIEKILKNNKISDKRVMLTKFVANNQKR